MLPSTQSQLMHTIHPQPKTPILLSYLDVVVQGYLAEFGEAGVARFFASTDGWGATNPK